MPDKPISARKKLQQRVKGTHDSPCLSICTHKLGHVVCSACGMLKEEKKGWRRRGDVEKAFIRQEAKTRLQSIPCKGFLEQS